MKLLTSIDGLLRAAFTDHRRVALEKDGISIRSLLLGALVLGGIYGAFMGLYGGMRPGHTGWEQPAASTIKVPLLFMLTLVVAFPSLYVFSALSGSKLRFLATLRLMLVAVTINLAVLASLGPVTAFFTLSTDSYAFMILLNVLFFTVGGVIGLRFLKGALDCVFDEPTESENSASEVSESHDGDASTASDSHRPWIPSNSAPRIIFRLWMLIYAIVGAQMGWILRPFIGSPGEDFALFRPRESNFFQAVVEQFFRLFAW